MTQLTKPGSGTLIILAVFTALAVCAWPYGLMLGVMNLDSPQAASNPLAWMGSILVSSFPIPLIIALVRVWRARKTESQSAVRKAATIAWFSPLMLIVLFLLLLAFG